MKRLPIKAAKDIAEKYNQNQVLLVTWDAADGRVHTVTYGRTIVDCEQAAIGMNKFRQYLGIAPALPARIKHREKNESK
jgi:hypothetical protein